MPNPIQNFLNSPNFLLCHAACGETKTLGFVIEGNLYVTEPAEYIGEALFPSLLSPLPVIMPGNHNSCVDDDGGIVFFFPVFQWLVALLSHQNRYGSSIR